MSSKEGRFLDRMYEVVTEKTTGEEIKATYDAWSDVYDDELIAENGYATPERVAETVAAHAPDLATLKVLDVGCGTGLGGVAIKEKGATSVDGCDFSPGMLEKAKARDVYGRLFEADLNKPPIDVANGAYDVAIAVGVFAFAHLGEAAVDEVLRCVKPGGLVSITANDPYYESGVLQAKFKKLEDAQAIEMLVFEHGDHIPGRGVGGWVFLMRKSA